MVRRVQDEDCLAQDDGYNYGIFAFAVIFYRVEHTTLNTDTFSQEDDVTTARSKLANTFPPKSGFISCDIFRKSFPMLHHESIIELSGLDIITPVSSIIRNSPSKSKILPYYLQR